MAAVNESSSSDGEDFNRESSLITNYAQILRDSIKLKQGVKTVKGILKRWGMDLRWQTVLELEALAADELRRVYEAVPEFYALVR